MTRAERIDLRLRIIQRRRRRYFWLREVPIFRDHPGVFAKYHPPPDDGLEAWERNWRRLQNRKERYRGRRADHHA